MEEKRTTLRDIARAAGVSIVTVHKALYAKSGVSEAMRRKILKLATEMHYSLNTVASSLKRSETHIAVVLQGLDNPENFFFRKMWDGVDKAEKELQDYRVRISRFECSDNWEHQEELLCEIGCRTDIDGVILHAWDESKLNPAIEYLWNKGIPVVTANSDTIGSKRVACVSAPNDRVGRLAAEVLGRMIPDGGRVLIAGGDQKVENLRANRLGFRAYLKELNPHTEVTEVYNYHDRRRFYDDCAAALVKYPDVTGVYVTTSRDTFTMCNALKDSSRARQIRVVGSDVFREMVDFFDCGVLHGSIWKDQESQAERAIMLLYQYLSKRPIDIEPVKMGIIMRNNIEEYL